MDKAWFSSIEMTDFQYPYWRTKDFLQFFCLSLWQVCDNIKSLICIKFPYKPDP